jgi:DNA-binding transcriptional LysR family regulator
VSEQSLPEADTDSAEARGRAGIAQVPTRLSAGARRRTARRSSSQSVVRPGKPDHMVRNSAPASRPVGIVDRIGAAGRSHAFLAPARLAAFIAAAEEGTFSAAARRLDVSQPALSQAVTALELQLGVQLLVRSSTGVRTTEAGITLLAEARAILVRHDQMVRTVTAAGAHSTGVIRLGIPGELGSDLLRVVARFAAEHPGTRVIPRYLAMAAQLASLRRGDLDVSFMREHPAGTEFDTMLVAQENLGILLAGDVAARLVGPDGIRLNDLAGLQWIGFPRSGSPAWYDELAATLGSHGIDTGDHTDGENFLIPSVTFTALSAGQAFAFASQEWAHPIPETVVWCALAGNPVVRRTWAVWPAECRNRDVAHLIASFECPTASA